MSKVVVLNASFEPLGVVPIRRALVYIVNDRADVIAAVPDAEPVRAADVVVERPLVVQFKHYVRVPYQVKNAVAPWSRRLLLDRDGHRCSYCGAHAGTVDHIVPRSRGGDNSWMNTVAACGRCNARKADKSAAEAGMSLISQPRVVYQRDVLMIAIAATGVDMAELGLVAA